jgi:Carbohydrate/starch-binding module (family 21)
MPYTPPSISPSGLHSISPVKSSSAYAGLANGHQPSHKAAPKLQQPPVRSSNHHRRSTGPQSSLREPIPVTAFNNQGPRRPSPVRRRNSSSTDTSDDEGSATSSLHQRHGRHLDNLKELREAIRDLPQVKNPSPPGSPDQRYLSRSPIAATDNLPKLDTNHTRYDSATSDGEQSSSTTPPEDSIEFPRMVRKKSGEVVKPSLKSTTQLRRRPASMPSTPVYTKNVHFDAQLEHVRHFKHSEKPLAVSTNTSPTAEFATNVNFPFDPEKSSEKQYQIELPNWPSGDQISRGDLPVRVDEVYLSANGRNLIGKVYVKNIAYSKWVAVRFTFDLWQTISEVSATYDSQQNTGLIPKDPEWDRFTFNIKLVDFTNIENRRMLFCVRYNIQEQEFWDNNYGANYVVEFRKRPNHLLRRATHPPELNGLSASTSDDSAISDDFDVEFTPETLAKELAERIASPKAALLANLGESKAYPLIKTATLTASPSLSSADLGNGAPQKRPTGKVFANRYDFSASLNAAIANASAFQGIERSAFKKPSSPKPTNPSESYFAALPSLFRTSPPMQSPTELGKEDDLVNNIKKSHLSGLQQTHHFRSRSYPLGSTSGSSPSWSVEGDREGYDSDDSGEKPPMDSTSYMDFINNYCFVTTPVHNDSNIMAVRTWET